MSEEFTVGPDPEEVKDFLHGIGLVTLDEYFIQVKELLKRQRQSSKLTNEQIQKKLMENGLFKDDLLKNAPILFPRKRTSFSPVITRKRGKAIKKRTPSATQVVVTTTTISTVSSTDEKSNEADSIDYDQPLDLRLRPNSTNKSQ